MASPVDAGRNTTTIATAADPWTVNLPASVQSGDLLIVYGRTGGNVTHNLPNGWSWLVQNDTTDASDDRSSVIYRWANGTEGSTLSWDLSGTAKGACISWRITGAANVGVQAPETPAAANSTTTANSADPPTVTPTGGSKDYLFIVLGGLDGEGQTFAHSVYVNDQTVNSGTVGSAATNCVIGGATRQATASSENPAAWTHGSASTGTSAWTIAVHPAVAITKTGAGIRGNFGSGERYRAPITYTETGKATMGIALADAAGNTYTKQNAGIASFSGTAADNILWPETGVGISSRAGTSGPDTVIHQELGSGISPRSVGGRQGIEVAKTGSGISPRAVAGSDQAIRAETGSGVLSGVGSGASQKQGGAVKTGAGIAGFSASAVDAALSAEAGVGISPRSASGADQDIAVESGSAIRGHAGTASDDILWPEDGKGILSAVGSGSKVVGATGTTYAKAGIAIMGRLQVPAITKTGVGIRGFVGSGASVKEGAGKGGFGIRGHSAAGARAMVYVEADAGGADAPEPPALEADHPANIVFKASGTATKTGQTISQKQNAGIRGHVGSGPDQSLRAETGAGILERVGAGSETKTGFNTYVKQNAGIAGFSASSLDAVIEVESGSGVRVQSGTAANELLWQESGAGIRGNVGSGSKTVGGFSIYIKQNAAVTGFVGSGTDSDTAVETGAGILARSGSGQRQRILTKTGAGILSFVGSGAKQALLGTTYAKSGSAILSATVGSVHARTISRSSAGILDRSGRGTDVVSWGETGKGIATFTAGGLRSYGRVPGGVTIVTQLKVELTVEGGLAAEVEVEDGSGALVTVG